MSTAAQAREDRHDRAIELVLRFEQRSGHQAAFRQLLGFMTEYLSLRLRALTPQARDAFATAERNKILTSPNGDIELARESCWRYLASQTFQYDFENKDNCAIRAVLCLLRREPPDVDLADTCCWFLSFADEVEDHSEAIAPLAMKYFA
jgi:hypothetical protein